MKLARQSTPNDERPASFDQEQPVGASSASLHAAPDLAAADSLDRPLAVESPARMLQEHARAAWFEDVASHEDRWPPGAGVLIVMGVCGTFWTGLILAVLLQVI